MAEKRQVYNKGYLTKDGKPVLGVTKINIKIAAENEDLPVIDSNRPYDSLNGTIKITVTMSKYHEDHTFVQHVLNGDKMRLIVYSVDRNQIRKTPLYQVTDFMLDEVTIGDIDGKKATPEDLTGRGSDIIPL